MTDSVYHEICRIPYRLQRLVGLEESNQQYTATNSADPVSDAVQPSSDAQLLPLPGVEISENFSSHGSTQEADAGLATSSEEQATVSQRDADMRKAAMEHTARILLSCLEEYPANDSTDYAYVQSLAPPRAGRYDGPLYTYPDNLPPGLVFVDCTGWLPAEECMRFLMLGYRVWNQDGRRMHLAGESLGYDSLKAPFRYATKVVCLQDESEVPDLLLQIETGDLYQDPPPADTKRLGMPWNVRRAAPEYVKKGRSLLTLAEIAWMESRFEHSRPCYSRRLSESYERDGGWKLLEPPLTKLSEADKTNLLIGPYPEHGVDLKCLSIQYPPTKITFEYNDSDLLSDGDKDGLCEVCCSLDFKDIFEWGLVNLDIAMGSLDDLVSRTGCKFCRVLAELCLDGVEFLQRIRSGRAVCLSRHSEPECKDGDPINVSLIRNPILGYSTKPCIALGMRRGFEILGPIISLRTVRGNMVGNFHATDPRWLPYLQLRVLIEACDTRHGPHCGKHSPSISESTTPDMTRWSPILLINVKRMCLETADLYSTRYAALSYVWGGTEMLCCRRNNLERLQEPNSLQDAGLSQLVKDAIEVVKNLNLDYLWVDALCIVQDDTEQKQALIEQMVDIYSEAYLTIVAVIANDTNASLPGVSVPFPRLGESIDGMFLTAQLAPLAWNAHNRTYEQRGWTFQERLISRRCLFFTERQFYLECGLTSAGSRELCIPVEDRHHQKFSFNFNRLRVWSHQVRLERGDREAEAGVESFSGDWLYYFCILVSQYTCRHFTYQSDIENAFLGIQSTINSMLRWEFVAGLPVGVFDWALLWLPWGHLSRRSWRKPQKDNQEGDSYIVETPPSWSWFGWKGLVSYACYTYHGDPFLQNLRPRVASYTIINKETKMSLPRYPSPIWHPDIRPDIERQRPVEDVLLDRAKQKATLPWLLDPTTTLEFEAETTEALINVHRHCLSRHDGDDSTSSTSFYSLPPHRTTSPGGDGDRGRRILRLYHNVISRTQSLSLFRARSTSSSSWSVNQHRRGRARFVAHMKSLTSLRSMSSVRTSSRDSIWRGFSRWRRRLSKSRSRGSSRTRTPSPIPDRRVRISPSVFQNKYLDEFDSTRDEAESQNMQEIKRNSTLRFPIPIEWLNTGPAYGMTRHGLRHDYNNTILEIARNQDPHRLELVAMVDCDIHQTFRGGQSGAQKLFVEEDRVVLMLILWNEDLTRAERIAIGATPKHRWERLGKDGESCTSWKTVRLV